MPGYEENLPRPAAGFRNLRRHSQDEEAATTCQDAAEIYRETGDRHNEGVALTSQTDPVDHLGMNYAP